jgi:hypothetical protein
MERGGGGGIEDEGDVHKWTAPEYQKWIFSRAT